MCRRSPADETTLLVRRGSALVRMVAFDVFGGRRTSLPQQIAGWRRPRSARGLAVLPAADYPTSVSLNRLAYEYGLKDELDGASASPDLELVRERGGPR